jgi:hypothetical protein
MDTHYNWNDATFKTRSGQSLNLAVNAVADVLHAFYSEAVVPEFPSNAILSLLLFLILPIVLFALRRKSRANKA